MIVETHYHYMHLTTPPPGNMADALYVDGERAGTRVSKDTYRSQIGDLVTDPDCDKLVKRMTTDGIDVTVMCVVDNVGYGGGNDRIMEANQFCAQAAAKHPGKLIALAGIDPRRAFAPDLLRRCFTEFGMKGLKWHPDNGYYPNSPEAYAMLKVLDEFGYPLLTHCSPLPGSKAKFAQPIHLDDVARDFPNLNIIAAHMGNLWWHDWLAIAQYKKNLHGDMAMWQVMAAEKPSLFRRYLREIVDNIGPYQTLWGTDGPLFEPLCSNKKYIEIMTGLTTKGSDGIVFTQEEVDAILGGNAARIFKLKR
jgi:predicted TIM-barrel fold metal-dependent hydrolase